MKDLNYLRLKSLSLSYSLPQKWINKGTPATTYYTNLAGQVTQADADDFAVSAAYETNSNGVESLIFKYNNAFWY